MIDGFGRDVTYLRISLTDRCNFRCRYCMPVEGVPLSRHEEFLTFDEIVQIARLANDLGIRSFRLTGGEPLVRKGVPDLVRALREHAVVDDLSMTTNGYLLARHARELKEAGLDRVNVSIDSLDPEKFRWIARGGDLHTVLTGLETALDVGLEPVKVNTVVIGGVNDDEMASLIQYLAVEQPVAVRFIEYMPIGEAPNAGLSFVNLTERREALTRELGLVPADMRVGNGPARYWKVPGGMGTVGFITPVSDKYCATCSRLRLDAKGTVRPCLAYDLGVSLRDALRSKGPECVREIMRTVILGKPAEHHWELGQVTPVAMSSLGG